MVDQVIVPLIAYEDGMQAMAWLCHAFGFRERRRFLDDDGSLSHSELEYNGALVMLSTPSPDYESPRTHRQHCEQARRVAELPWTIDGVLVYVRDIDAHYARAVDAGAAILTPLTADDYGRLYRAEDLEGHRWMFLEPPKAPAE